jgi:hypothetical protein
LRTVATSADAATQAGENIDTSAMTVHVCTHVRPPAGLRLSGHPRRERFEQARAHGDDSPRASTLWSASNDSSVRPLSSPGHEATTTVLVAGGALGQQLEITRHTDAETRCFMLLAPWR